MSQAQRKDNQQSVAASAPNSTEQVQQEEQPNEEQKTRRELIVRNLQEVLGGEKLTKQIASGKNIHVYWGTAITGRPHIGYFVPMQKIADFLRANLRVTILFADLHGFLDNMKSSFKLLQNRVLYYECVIKALMAAFDVPVEKLHFVRGQSYQLSEAYTKDLLRLCGQVSLRDAIRSGAEVVKQVDDPFLGGILYPLLQALDEQHLKVDGQFGGVDQRKIFILAEEQLPKLKLGKRFHLMNPMVPGLTGVKMSSSEADTKIDLLDTPEMVSAKIDSAACSKPKNGEENGVLAFFKHVVFPICGEREVELGAHQIFDNFEAVQSTYESDLIDGQDLKQFLKQFLNGILAKVQENCRKNPDFEQIVANAYPTSVGTNEDEEANCAKKVRESNAKQTFQNPFGHTFEFVPSERLSSHELLHLSDRRQLRVMYRLSPKGPIKLAHFVAFLHLKWLQTLGHQCTVLISDLDAFLDRAKCPWAELQKRTAEYAKVLRSIASCVGLSDEQLPIRCSAEYQYGEKFTIDMYRVASAVTKDETALVEGGNTLACHLCPIYFALDVMQDSAADLVLIGPNQERYAQLTQKISHALKMANDRLPAFLIQPEVVGMNGLRMSTTTIPEFYLDLVADGAKKVRQKVGKSFCEPGNTDGNVALQICKALVFPFHKQVARGRPAADEEVPTHGEKGQLELVIGRAPKNGGDLPVHDYAELEALFLEQKLHPADLKEFVCSQINDWLDAVRTGRPLMP